MNTRDLEDFARFAIILHAHEKPSGTGNAVRDAGRLRRMARSLAGLGVAECNRELTTREEMRAKALRNDVWAIAQEFGCERVSFGDPRGAALRLHWRDTSYAWNNGSGTGLAVPE